MVFLAVVVLPALRQPAYRAVALPLIHATGVRFGRIGWATVATLVATGIANLGFRGYGWAQVQKWSSVARVVRPRPRHETDPCRDHCCCQCGA